MANTALPNVFTVSTIRCFPEVVALTGTITSTGVDVVGTGTAFLSEICFPNNPGQLKYKYIFNSATGEVMEIYSVNSDTHLRLKTAFASNVSGQSLVVPNNYYLRAISITPLAAGVIMYTPNAAGVTLADGLPVNIENEYGILPIGINGSGHAAQVATN